MIHNNNNDLLLASSDLYINLTETSAPCLLNKQMLKLLIGFSVSVYATVCSPTSGHPTRPAGLPLSCSYVGMQGSMIHTGMRCSCPEAQRTITAFFKKHRNRLSINVRALRHQSLPPNALSTALYIRHF